MYMNARSVKIAPWTRGSVSHDLFDRELVALRALRDPLPALRRPIAGRPRRLRGLHEGLRPGRVEGEGLESDEVVQLLHDLRRQDRLELGKSSFFAAPRFPRPAMNSRI